MVGYLLKTGKERCAGDTRAEYGWIDEAAKSNIASLELMSLPHDENGQQTDTQT